MGADGGTAVMGLAHSPRIVTDGLVLCLDAASKRSYPGTGTTWIDLTGGNDGALANGPTFNDENGGSVVFDGTDDYVDFGNILNMGTGDISFNAWVKRTGGDGEQDWIFSKSYAGDGVGRYWLDFDNNTTLRVGAAWASGHTNYYFSGTFNQDVWYNYAVVFDRDDKLYLYINGELNTSHDISAHSNVNMTNTYPYRLGSYTDSNQSTAVYFLNGKISCHLHYNRALSEEEIRQNYEATVGRYS